MIKLINFQKADIGIGGISMTYQRSQAVKYPKIYLFSPLTYMTPAKSLGFSNILILEPFTTSLWIIILFALIFMIIYQKFIVYNVIKNRRHDITWPLISALVRQGNFISFKLLLDFQYLEKPKNFPKTTSIRLIYLFWCFACLIINNYYAGELYSIMTIPLDVSLDTIEKLANEQANGRIQVIVTESVAYYKIFKVYINLAKKEYI